MTVLDGHECLDDGTSGVVVGRADGEGVEHTYHTDAVVRADPTENAGRPKGASGWEQRKNEPVQDT